MKRFIKLIIIMIFFAGIIYVGWHRTILSAAPQAGFYKVTYVYDGDTIAVDMNGVEEKIRFVGVDTPETHKPNTPVQCYAEIASKHTKKILSGSRVRLVADSQGTNRDRYNRLLRYVYLSDGTLYNKKLIEEGYGFAYTVFPFEKSEEFKAAQALTMTAKKGIWGSCEPKVDGGAYRSPDAASTP